MTNHQPTAEELRKAFTLLWQQGCKTPAEEFLLTRGFSATATVLRDLLHLELSFRVTSLPSMGILSDPDAGTPADAQIDDTVAYIASSLVPVAVEFNENATELEVHDRTIGKYVVREVLGSGGFSVVYRAWDPDLGRDVAVKRMRDSSQQPARDLEILHSEAKLLSQLRHPHVVPVFAFELDCDGRPYIVSEYIRAQTLKAIIATSRPSFSRSAAICAAVARALHHAHKCQIVHRDVKPANILLESNGHVWLTDFGLGASTKVTGSLAISGGTPSYMSPEQADIDDRSLDPRTDIFSLGVVLYELLTGVKPFQAASRAELRELHRRGARSCRYHDERISQNLDEICLRALRRNPEDRFAMALDFAEAIEGEVTYSPAPIDVSKVAVPESLQQLLEDLARNNHDNWAAQRIGEGWQVGDVRNDERRTHPDLIPYEQLPECEKEYDRKTVEHTIRAILANGYTIQRKEW